MVSATKGRRFTPAASHSSCVLSWEHLVLQYSVAAWRPAAAATAHNSLPLRRRDGEVKDSGETVGPEALIARGIKGIYDAFQIILKSFQRIVKGCFEDLSRPVKDF